jgi:prepilin-type N-terminal cleavage/methylation domain-containing protein
VAGADLAFQACNLQHQDDIVKGSSNHRQLEYASGFSLLEMMMVLTLILLAATITQPIYQNMILRGWRRHRFGMSANWSARGVDPVMASPQDLPALSLRGSQTFGGQCLRHPRA